MPCCIPFRPTLGHFINWLALIRFIWVFSWLLKILKDSICLHVSPRKTRKCSFDLILEKNASSKVSNFFSIVIVSLAPHREFEQNDYREDAPHFRISMSPIFVINSLPLVTFHHICQYIHKLISHMVRQIIF